MNTQPTKKYEQKIVNRYIDNPITTSIVISGLERFDSYKDLFIINMYD